MKKYFKIADVTINIEYNEVIDFELYSMFQLDSVTFSGKSLKFLIEKFKQIPTGYAKEFSSMTLYKSGDSILYLGIDDDGSLFYRMSIDEDSAECKIEYSTKKFSIYQFDMFDPPIRQALYNHLIHISGIAMHAACIGWQDSAVLFTAQSGTGKSTQAFRWIAESGAFMLDGDHPILRKVDGKWHAYGTPWPGDPPISVNMKLPVRAILEVVRASENRIVLLEKGEAIRALIPRSYIPYQDEKQMDLGLKVLTNIVTELPIYRLYCKPDSEAMEIAKECIRHIVI